MGNGVNGVRQERDRIPVNGVFEGGGAKGLAYVGALRAAQQAGLDFRSVAGSSAGAITATLVACGFDADTIEKRMDGAMGAFGGSVRAAMSVHRRSLLSSRRLREWLVETIAAKPGDEPCSGECTFAELKESTGRRLYVVTTDLAERQPLVFSWKTTPDATVADAVVASCAIPVAFPAQRMRIDGQVHRLADGGVWANYPHFVFTDRDFRDYHGLEDEEAEEGTRRTVGFVLDEVDLDERGLAQEDLDERSLAARQEERRASRLDRLRSVRHEPGRPSSDDRGGARRELGAVGGLLTSPLVFVAALAAPVVGLVAVHTQYANVFGDFAGLTERGDPLLLLLFAAMAAFSAMSIAGGLVVLRLVRGLVDEGTVGAAAAMGVGPTVPYWIGNAPTKEGTSRDHVVVRLPVGTDLGTLAFRPPAALATATVDRAYITTAQALLEAGLVPEGRLMLGTSSRALEQSPGGTTATTWPTWLRRLAYVIAVPVFSFVAALVPLDGLLRRERLWQELLRLAVVMVLVLGGLVAYGARRHRRALTPPAADPHVLAWSVVGVIVGVGLLAGSVALTFKGERGHRMTDYLGGTFLRGELDARSPVERGSTALLVLSKEDFFQFLQEQDVATTDDECFGREGCIELPVLDQLATKPGDVGEFLYLPGVGIRSGLPDMRSNALEAAALLSSLVLTANATEALRRSMRARRREAKGQHEPALESGGDGARGLTRP